MALKGNLRDFSTTQLLNLINLARKTGTLTLEGPQVATMSFREGKLIYATLGENGSGLAFVLQKSGILTERQGQIVQTKAADTSDKQLGHMLIKAGYATQSDIIQSIRQHILDVAYKLFTWVEGLFRFDANQVPSSDRITVPIDLESVILEGSRRLQEWEHLQEELPDLDIRLRFPENPNDRLQNVNLTIDEWRVVSFVNPRNSVRQIAKASNLSDFQIRRIVYGMIQAGLVEVVDPIHMPVRKSDTSADLQAEDKGDGKPAVDRSIVKRLIRKIRRL
ncbi:MAG: DUF4388 domain-containing protein [Anaerolineae bacterium]|nr:MAG: DUF4388 domain-containing protein [Anaerolineae bacterium]